MEYFDPPLNFSAIERGFCLILDMENLFSYLKYPNLYIYPKCFPFIKRYRTKFVKDLKLISFANRDTVAVTYD